MVFTLPHELNALFLCVLSQNWNKTHARRYFADVSKALPKAAQKTAKDTVAYEVLKQIGAIFHLDNPLSDLEPEDRKKQRQMTVRPLVEAFFAWAKEVESAGRLPKGKTLEGIHYCINQEDALKVFLNDGEVPLDNNATEGALRSFCLHKHAWKLIDSIDGAKSSAIIYSITETVFASLRFLFYFICQSMSKYKFYRL